ncbi:MAG: glycosyltransferase family 4 protein [Promethearchaeota archaeon]
MENQDPMINVAMLTPFFTGQLGGPYNVIMDIVPYLEEFGVSSKVFTTSSIKKYGRKYTEFYEKKYSHFEIYRFHSLLRFKEYRISLEMLPFMVKNNKSIDIVHSHALRSYQEDIGTLYCLAKKKPLVISPHGGIAINWDYRDKIPKMISDKSVGIIKNYLKPHYVAVTKMEIPLIKNLGVDEDHIHFIPHGVNMEIFKPVDANQLKTKLGLETSKIILYVGRIAKGKGVDKLINIFSQVKKEHKDAKLVIVGDDGGYLSITKLLINKYNLANDVILTGFISKNNLSQYYSMADLVIYPSRQEIFGLVLCEAMACRKPVIGSNILGPSEIIINGETGFTSDFENIDELSNLINNLLDDKIKLKEMGDKGYNRVKKYYTWRKCANSHFNLYKMIQNSL